MASRTLRRQMIGVRQIGRREWVAEYAGISTAATTRNKALLQMATIMDRIDKFAAQQNAEGDS